MFRLLFPPLDNSEGGVFFYRWPRVFSATKTGVICAFGSLGINLIIPTISREIDVISSDLFGFSLSPAVSLGGKYLLAVTLGPIVETFLFLLSWLSLTTIKMTSKTRELVFVILLSLLSWLMHGADLMAISRMFGFAVLAILFAGWARRETLYSAFWTTALAHCIWNALAFLLIALIRFSLSTLS